MLQTPNMKLNVSPLYTPVFNVMMNILSNKVPFEKDRVEVMGSFALFIWQRSQGLTGTWAPNDVDVYVRASSLYRFIEQVEGIFKDIETFLEGFTYDDNGTEHPFALTTTESEACFKPTRVINRMLSFTIYQMKLSFIYVPEKMALDTVCDSFDITCCQFRMLVHKDGEFSVTPHSVEVQELTQGNKAIAYHNETKSVKKTFYQYCIFPSRWYKYKARGFEMTTMPIREEAMEFATFMEHYYKVKSGKSKQTSNWFVLLFAIRVKSLASRARQSVIDSHAKRPKRTRAHFESILEGKEIDIKKYKLE